MALLLGLAWIVLMLTLVCATTQMPEHFERGTLLGRSLRQFPKALRPRLFLVAGNRGPKALGLPEIYNQAIRQLPQSGIVAFVHDDLYVHDWFLQFRLEQALRYFDLVGLTGEGDPGPEQGSWYFDRRVDGRWYWSQRRPSGFLNHFDPALTAPSDYGPTPRRSMVLDGVFLAMKLETIKRTGLEFDPQFRFHSYDIDFCRSALELGLSLGTWPIACTHASPGRHDSQWEEAVSRYQTKWEGRPWPDPPVDDLPAGLI